MKSYKIILALSLIILLNTWFYFLNNDNPPKERYFYITTFYTLQDNSGEGYYTFSYKSSQFPSMQWIDSTVIKDTKKPFKKEIAGVTILDIYEFENEKDFNNFNKN